MCCKGQKQGSRQAWYSWDTLKRKEINWGRTSAPLLFSNTFWVISSTNFWDDQNKYGANTLCFSHSWNLICVKVLTFPQVSARKGKLKRCYQQPRFSGWKNRGFLRLLWFTTCCFLSRHTWNGCVNPGFWRGGGGKEIRLTICSSWTAFAPLKCRNTEGQVKRCFISYTPTPPHPPASQRPPSCTPFAIHPPVIFLTFIKVHSLSLPPRVCLHSPFGLCL